MQIILGYERLSMAESMHNYEIKAIKKNAQNNKKSLINVRSAVKDWQSGGDECLVIASSRKGLASV